MPEELKNLQTEEKEGEITSWRKSLEYSAKDEELLSAINTAVAESKELKEVMDKIGKINKLYWKNGTAKDLSRLHPKKAKIVTNRIFTDIETSIPILTSEPPEPTIINAGSNDLKNRLSQGLKIAYEVKYKMQQKLQTLLRHWYLQRIGILKYRWDKENGFTTENVLSRKIGFDKRATSKENCEFMWEELEDTIENLAAKFPKKKKEIKGLVTADRLKSKVKYLEFWGGKGNWVCWKLQQIILDKKKNLNYDFSDPQNNVFKKAEFPYLLLNVFSTGDETALYDEISLVEEAAPLQEGANQLEQQILDLNEGQKRVWGVSGEAMSKEQFDSLVKKTGDLGVYYDRKAPAGALQQIQSGKPDASFFNHLSHILTEIDNIFGMHSTTRGERKEQETLGGRQLLMGSDYGRLDLIVRNVEQVMEEWYSAYLQCIKVYSVEAEVLEDQQGQRTEIGPEEIPTGLIVMIKKGSTLPTDDITRFQNAIQLASAGMIDPATLFEEMQYSNVEKRTADLYAWLQATGKIAPQQQVQNQERELGDRQGQQLQRLQQILNSPQAKNLPPEEQQALIKKGRQIVSTIKGGA